MKDVWLAFLVAFIVIGPALWMTKIAPAAGVPTVQVTDSTGSSSPYTISGLVVDERNKVVKLPFQDVDVFSLPSGAQHILITLKCRVTQGSLPLAFWNREAIYFSSFDWSKKTVELTLDRPPSEGEQLAIQYWTGGVNCVEPPAPSILP